ncbi:MAG: hypothetical protein ACEQSB_00675 [Undibacterium sp.]
MWINLTLEEIKYLRDQIPDSGLASDQNLTKKIDERLASAFDPLNVALTEKAREKYGSDDIEVDDQSYGASCVSQVDEGVWVLGWLWVAREEGESD